MEDVKETGLKQDVGIEGVKLSKEAETEEDVIKAMLIAIGEKDVLVLLKKEKRRLNLCQKSVKGNWKISKLV